MVYIGLPSQKDRLAIFRACLKDTPLEQCISDDDSVYLKSLCTTLTKGLSGADISLMCNRARRLAIERSVKTSVERVFLEKEGARDSSEDAVNIEDFEAARKSVAFLFFPPSVPTRIPFSSLICVSVVL